MALMNKRRLIPLVQEKWVRATSSHRLVPGDVIVLQKGRALCDVVLLQGACMVTESMLSGEVQFWPLCVNSQHYETSQVSTAQMKCLANFVVMGSLSCQHLSGIAPGI